MRTVNARKTWCTTMAVAAPAAMAFGLATTATGDIGLSGQDAGAPVSDAASNTPAGDFATAAGWDHAVPAGSGGASCQLDDGGSSNALGLTDGGVIGWAQRYSTACSDTIENIATTYGWADGTAAPVQPGDPVGYAILEDTGSGPGSVIFQDQGTVDGDSINTDTFQTLSVDPPQSVSGSFYLAVWVEHGAGTFPAPMDEDSAPTNDDDVFLIYEVGGTFGGFDPGNPPTTTNMADIGFPTAWMLRGNEGGKLPPGACCFEDGVACPEDLTGDGEVGGADLGTLLSAWGPCDDPNDCPEDLTGDGEVGGADLGTLLSAWGPCEEGGGGCEIVDDQQACLDLGGLWLGQGTTCDSCPENVDCPSGAADEGEPCGDDTTGGCNMDNPAFGPELACGESVCGTGWAFDGSRDTDWYPFTVDGEQTQVTWSVEAEFNAVALIIDANEGCIDELEILASGTGMNATAEACLPPGDYWLFVAPNGFEGQPCGAFNDYTATVEACEANGPLCPEQLSNCCEPEPGQQGCDDAECEAAVCDVDAFCCNIEWDSGCASLAEDLCGDLCEEPGPEQAEYQYDIGETSNALGLTDGGVIGWAQRYDAADGSGTISNVATTYGWGDSGDAGVSDGDPVGIAIMDDSGSGPGTVAWSTTGTIDGSAINSDVLQVFSVPDVDVSGEFFIVFWVEHGAGTFPAPMDEFSLEGTPAPFADDVYLIYTVGGTFGAFDPENPGSVVTMDEIEFPSVFVNRGNQDN